MSPGTVKEILEEQVRKSALRTTDASRRRIRFSGLSNIGSTWKKKKKNRVKALIIIPKQLYNSNNLLFWSSSVKI